LPIESNALGRDCKLETVDDIWNEIFWFITERLPALKKLDQTKKREITLGQELWINQFFDSNYILEPWMIDLISLVNTSMTSGIPIATSLMDCPVLVLDYNNIITDEIIAIRNF